MYIGLQLVIIKFHQVLIENDLQLDINAKLDLESQDFSSSNEYCWVNVGHRLHPVWLSAWQQGQEEVEEGARLMEEVEMEAWQRRMMSSAEPPSLERMMSSSQRLSSNGVPHSQTLISFQTVCLAAT